MLDEMTYLRFLSPRKSDFRTDDYSEPSHRFDDYRVFTLPVLMGVNSYTNV